VGQVIGRDPELRIVDAFIANLAGGPHALVLRGEAGIGKTTLWAEALERGRVAGFLVLSSRAAAAEASLTLTTLADLLDASGGADAVDMPAAQRRAIDAALLRGADDVTTVQPRLLGAAVRTILARLLDRGPVILAVDDAQWADAASATVIGYAVRRLAGRPLGLAFTQRTGEPPAFDLGAVVGSDRIVDLELGPITIAALHHIIKERRGTSLSRSTLIRVHEASGGSPLFALEIARILDSTGVPPIGRPLPVPHDIRVLLRQRIARLPPGTREVLLLAAALGRAPIATLDRAFGRSVAADLKAALDDETIRLEGGAISFQHPLLAGVVYEEASDAHRRAAHVRAAAAVDGFEERARHRALATSGPDASVADDLAEAARQALRRAAPSMAADLARMSIELTPPDHEGTRAARTIDLAGYLKRAGDSDGAVQALEDVIRSTTERRTRANARLVLAGIRHETDEPSVATELAALAVDDAAGEPELLARAHAVLAAVAWEDHARRAASADEATRLLETVEDPDPEIVGLVAMERTALDVDLGRPLDEALIERALEAERRSAAVNIADRFSAALGPILKLADDLDRARAWIEWTYEVAVEEGDEGSLAYAVSHLPELELWAGNWDSAETMARRHLALAAEFSLESQRRQALYNLGIVLAHRGRTVEARECIAEGLRASAEDDGNWSTVILVPVLGFIELSEGDMAAAAASLRRASALRDAIGQTRPRRHDPDLVEALVGLGLIDEAAAVSAAMDRRAAGSGRWSSRAAASRSRALVAAARGDVDDALAAARDALAELDRAPAPFPFDRARAWLVLGRVHRRRRERRAAIEAFDAAILGFQSVGAALWAGIARADRDRVGIRRAESGLTESERRVAELAASGLTNREVAGALFISPKTVEANLSRIYDKLGIRSRAQLAQRLARATGAPGQT